MEEFSDSEIILSEEDEQDLYIEEEEEIEENTLELMEILIDIQVYAWEKGYPVLQSPSSMLGFVKLVQE